MIEEIIQGNKLIAEFLVKEKKGRLFITKSNGEAEFNPTYNSDLHFHDKWSWLMPVIEKICRIRVGDGVELVDYSYPRTFGMLNEQTGKIMVRLNGHILFEADTLIEATWLAVVDFIKMQGV